MKNLIDNQSASKKELIAKCESIPTRNIIRLKVPKFKWFSYENFYTWFERKLSELENNK